MRRAEIDGKTRAFQIMFVSGVSVLASVWTVAAQASDRTSKVPQTSRCAAYGEGFIPMEGVDGCLRVGGHVRVDAQVMRGAATLGAGGALGGDGPAPAGMRTGAAPTQRMRVLPGGDLFSR